ncbi:MAG: NHLP family bacteriocin export ABC transporter peptidase/permease/ATPase subunit [Myxococcota bacterium]
MGIRQKLFGTPVARVPTVLQMEAVECGAASLAMILAHYGRWIPLEALRIDCGVSRDGTNAANIVKAAKGHGLEARGLKKDIAALADLKLPAVLFWNFNHFVVLEGFSGKYAHINDPAFGRRRVAMAEFDESYTGVVLTFKPGEDFQTGDGRPGFLQALLSRVSGSELAIAFIALVGLGMIVPGLILPVFARVFVDEILVGGNNEWLRPLLGGIAVTAAIRGMLTWLQAKALLRLGSRIALKESARFLWHVLRLPIDFFNQRSPGEISERVGSNFRVAQLLAGDVAGTFINALLVVFYLLLMVQYDLVLTAIGVFFAFVNLGAVRLTTTHRAEQSLSLLQESGKLYGVGVGGLGQIETIKATGSEGDFFSRWSGQHAKVIGAQQRMSISDQLLQTVPSMLDVVGNLAVLSIGAMRVMDGEMTMGMLIAFQSLLASFMGPVAGIVGLGAALQTIRGDMTRLDDVLRYAPEIDVQGESTEVDRDAMQGRPGLSGRITLDAVTFGYNRLARPVVRQLKLDVPPGSRVALVGPSGSGKSTVARIIAGLHTPWSGEVCFDGIARQHIPRAVVASSVAAVSQEISLFEGTIRDNLTLWDPSVPNEDIIRAARDACVHEVISTRPSGYDAPVTEGGANFSGGQRQRLEIARALVGNPSVLILDEATSALDPLTEQALDKNLRKRGCTCVVVAHRLSTIRDADEIVLLDKGKVVERGTHDELLANGKRYAKLIAES